MRLLLQELKKLFRPQYLVAAVVLIFLGCFTSYIGFGSMRIQAHTDIYPQEIPMDSNYSMELLFKDTLLKKYGPTIEKSELPLLRAQYERLGEQVRRAVESDEILSRCGGHLMENFELAMPLQTSEGEGAATPAWSDADQAYILRYINGQLQFPGTDAPVYFVQHLYHLLPELETDAQNISEEDTVYTVMSTTLLDNLVECLHPVLLSGLCSLFLIVPYGILENRRGTAPILYASRYGRRTDRFRLLAIAVCVLLFLAMGLLHSALIFDSWDVDCYYGATIDSAMMEIKNSTLYSHFEWSDVQLHGMRLIKQTAYSGITFLQLYIQLCSALVLAFLALALILSTVVSSMRNIFSASITALPVAVLGYLFFNRYVSSAIGFPSNFFMSSSSPWFLFCCRGEVWITVIALLLIACTSVGIRLHTIRKCA